MIGVAIVRGKGIPTTMFSQEVVEEKSEFMLRVINHLSDPSELEQRNTLTIEFVWSY